MLKNSFLAVLWQSILFTAARLKNDQSVLEGSFANVKSVKRIMKLWAIKHPVSEVEKKLHCGNGRVLTLPRRLEPFRG